MLKNEKLRNVIFILLGVLLLIIKPHYSGPFLDIVRSYLGNFSISFAVYFIVQFNDYIWKANKLVTAIAALVVVNLFELTNGFGVMTNVYDVIDLLANFGGVLLALVLDIVTFKFALANKQ